MPKCREELGTTQGGSSNTQGILLMKISQKKRENVSHFSTPTHRLCYPWKTHRRKGKKLVVSPPPTHMVFYPWNSQKKREKTSGFSPQLTGCFTHEIHRGKGKFVEGYPMNGTPKIQGKQNVVQLVENTEVFYHSRKEESQTSLRICWGSGNK
jgi:hypothetical protein